uniref:Dynamin-binding protein n=1 Tax=Paramormyrops kingsleyae TaxID=1676925 RepID=A0A3B3SMQ4_9TELE|nr:rho guanine nucleotide exchange factor 38 [Paramormyrops kingsleyae]XP_023654878.1 rho guanine nucleotide exchange factor 38 [Paramormyrops kingsleyae]
MEPKEAGGEGGPATGEKKVRKIKRPNGLFVRHLERRKTDTIVDDDVAKADVNISTLVRRTQSDKTEYSTKLKGKMAPQSMSSTSSTTSLDLDPEEQRDRKMSRRSKVIQELLQTERDYLTDLELCIREVLLPLREAQVVEVDRLFSNMEAVRDLSYKLLGDLREAMAETNPEAQAVGDIFIQAKAELEDVYKEYCYEHDDANALLKTYEKDEEIRQHFRNRVLALKKIYDQEGKSNLLDMGSLLIKPVQRVMKYPLLLGELWQATPEDHPDRQPLEEALAAVKVVNININEFKRRKDIVMRYIKPDEEENLIAKLNKFSIHSIRKKSDRLTSYLKMLTGAEPLVKDEAFDREEKLFRSLEKAVRLLVKNVCCYLHHVQEMTSLATDHAQDLEKIIVDPDRMDCNGSIHRKNGGSPYRHFKESLERLVLTPLSTLQGMFPGPQKLIQKRQDKLLDCYSRQERPGSEEQLLARRDYEALNAQLVDELKRFNCAARAILDNCLHCLAGLLRGLLEASTQRVPTIQQLPAPLSNICEVQSSIIEGLNNLSFVKDNAPRLMERKVSFEKLKKISPPEVARQTEVHRTGLLASYPLDRMYQLKRNCNACQQQDVSLLEGELVALLEDQDPLGSSSRWLVDTGGAQGYVYSTFLKPYNPTKDRPGVRPEASDDFDNISLFVSGGAGGSRTSISGSVSTGSLRGFCLDTVDGAPTSDGLQGEPEAPEDENADDQQFYAVYAFQARCSQELTLRESQHVRILRFCDLGGNREWWLAEAEGQQGYVPANYLGKMSYA